MRILFIGSGCACRLPFVEHLFKKKIQDGEVQGIEIESADMTAWGVTSKDELATESQRSEEMGDVLKRADLIVVMEERQRNFLTRFLDYNNWNKIHLFPDYCSSIREHLMGSVCGDLNYQTQDEEVSEGCANLISRIRTFLKEHLNSKAEMSTLTPA